MKFNIGSICKDIKGSNLNITSEDNILNIHVTDNVINVAGKTLIDNKGNAKFDNVISPVLKGNLSGISESAVKLNQPIDIEITGDSVGHGLFDGSSDACISVSNKHSKHADKSNHSKVSDVSRTSDKLNGLSLDELKSIPSNSYEWFDCINKFNTASSNGYLYISLNNDADTITLMKNDVRISMSDNDHNSFDHIVMIPLLKGTSVMLNGETKFSYFCKAGVTND